MAKLTKEQALDAIVDIAHENNFSIALALQAVEEGGVNIGVHICEDITSPAMIKLTIGFLEVIKQQGEELAKKEEETIKETDEDS